MLVLVCVASGLVGALSANQRIGAVREIETRSEPLAADAVEVYRSLASADAIVASEFLAGAVDASRVREQYDSAIARAAASLASAATRGGARGLTADRIADIAVQVPVYTGLVEQARANKGRPPAGGIDSLQRASELMQSTILRRAQALQRNESQRLDVQYGQARAVPRLALATAAGALAVLLAVQVYLLIKTKRVFNDGLVAATTAILLTLAWWALALRASHPELNDSRRHSGAVTDALGQAQIAARQARASEILGLVAPDNGPHEQDFLDRMQRLYRKDGAGGALGAARRLAPEAEGNLAPAVGQARAWLTAHDGQLRAVRDERRSEAIALAVDPNRPGSAKAFNELDGSLAAAAASERTAFRRDIDQAQGALTGLVAGVGLLPLLSAGCAAVGIRQRLRDYPQAALVREGHPSGKRAVMARPAS